MARGFLAPFIVTYTYICFSVASSRPRGRPSPPTECSPTMSYDIHSFGKGLDARLLSTQNSSTSELLRTL